MYVGISYTFIIISSRNFFKNCSATGNCPIFTSKGFIDWKPCNMSLSSCPNTSYVSDDVYKCKLRCSSKVSYTMFCVIMQLYYFLRVHYSIPPQIRVVLVTTACMKNRTYHSVFIDIMKIRVTIF